MHANMRTIRNTPIFCLPWQVSLLAFRRSNYLHRRSRQSTYNHDLSSSIVNAVCTQPSERSRHLQSQNRDPDSMAIVSRCHKESEGYTVSTENLVSDNFHRTLACAKKIGAHCRCCDFGCTGCMQCSANAGTWLGVGPRDCVANCRRSKRSVGGSLHIVHKHLGT